MTEVLAPFLYQQFFVQNGTVPAVGYKVFSYIAGTSTKQATFSDSVGTPNTNPIILDSAGTANVWLDPTLVYKFVIAPPNDTDPPTSPTRSIDNVYPSLNVSNLTQSLFGSVLYPPITAEGNSVVNAWYPYFHVDRYGTNTTPLTTPMQGAWSAATAAAQVAGGIVRCGAGPYLTTAPINATYGTTANQFGVLIQGNGFSLDQGNFPIVARHTGVAIFDCTGNDAITFSDIAMTTNASVYPQTGILFARVNIAGNNSQINRLSRVSISGSFSVAPFYNYGSEDDVLEACYFANFAPTVGTKTRCYTGNNISGLISPFVTIRTGSQSCIDHNAFGCQDANFGGTTTSDCVYLEQTDSYKSYGGWAYSGNNTSNGRSLVYVDMSNSTSNFCVIDGLTGEQATFQQANGILFSNNTQTPAHFSVRGCKLNAVTSALAAGALVTLDDLTFDGNSCPIGGISIPGTLQNSNFDVGNETPLVIGTSKNNRLSGSTANFTITTRNKDNWIDTGVTNRAIATVTTSGGITSSAGPLIARAEIIFSGPCFTFQVLLASGSGNLAISGGSTLTITAPGGQSLTLADTAQCSYVDTTAGTINGAQVTNSGSSLLVTLPTAVSATAHSIVVSGSVFVA